MDLRSQIQNALANFQGLPLRDAARQLLANLGYRSDKFLIGAGSEPQDFLENFTSGRPFDETKALVAEWKTADLLFQLTDQELSRESSLFTDDSVQRGLLRSYIFIAIELTGDYYARGKLTALARQLNRLFPMPVMVLIKHGGTDTPVFGSSDTKQTRTPAPLLSIAVINRRRNKIDDSKDVLGKVTIIRDISLTEPHRGHLDILAALALPNLVHPQRLPITSFDTLHAAWERIFNIELLNDRFYRELSSWYFWAMRHVHFPTGDLEADKSGLFQSEDKVREHDAKHLIRLLTRLLFVWFIKEKGLIPEELFRTETLAEKYLDGFQSDSKETRFYKAILQNLFFATLNQTRGKREFRKDGQHQNTTNLLRHRRLLKDPATFIDTVQAVVPFLNGGLFECLDHPHPTKTGSQGGKAIVYVDGFSDRDDNPLKVPDFLFFGPKQQIDLSEEFGDTKRKKETVRGLIHIFDSFKFTIVENTPIDQEIALDPELLGKVFENLLASYNPETKTTARKQTGSFYTPRPIVDYMVDESLKAHLARPLIEKAGMTEADARAGLDILFAYTDREHAFTPAEVAILIEAIDTCNILDPACGSGAFPMGVLHKLVHILAKLDPKDRLWKERQLEKVDATIRAAAEIDDATIRDSTIADLEAQKADIEETFTRNELGYGRKLFLIENCLYGVDIQSIATQVSKLRFFISLVVDQTVDPARDNFGIRPLPNLETKFVTADTLIAIENPGSQGELFELANVSKLQKELKTVRHNLFSAKTPRTKDKYRKRDQELREAIAAELETNGWDTEVAAKLARWDPYNQNASADFFDPEWMFDRPDFDIVIGNPPYIQIQKFPKAQKDKWVVQNFQTYSATADIYCLFYERGAQLLSDGGHLAYITSNKWMRAGYGDSLRDFFVKHTRPKQIIDFGGIIVFNSATVDSVIVLTAKSETALTCRSAVLSLDYRFTESLDSFIQKKTVEFTLPTTGASSWVILPPERHAIKQQVEAQGIPLKDWDIAINYGIKTGFNDAFYLTQEQRDAFVAADPRCAEFLVPLLRGRYVSRYATDWDGTWMINSHNGIKEQGIPPVNISTECPLLFKHLLQWESELRKRQDKGDHWSNLRNCAYLLEFSKPKIIYPNMTKFLPFYYDRDEGFFTNDKGFILTSTGDSIEYLTAFLNSSLFKCCFRDNFPNLGEDRRELRKIFVDILPVRKPTPTESALFEKLVPLVQYAKKQGQAAPATFLEDLIDACVMECYFREHMAERDLLFHDTVAPHLDGWENVEGVARPFSSSPQGQAGPATDFLTHLHATLNAPSHPIRNRLDRICTDSPDLLAIIKQEGKV